MGAQNAPEKCEKMKKLNLTTKEIEEANRLTRRFCADPTFDALCKRYPTLRLEPYELHSTDYRDMLKLRSLYEKRTGKPAFK